MPLALLLLACGPGAGRAAVSTQADAPVDLKGTLTAAFLEAPGYDPGDGYAVVVLVEEERTCEGLEQALLDPTETGLVYTARGLAFSLQFQSYAPDIEQLPWEDVYWWGGTDSVIGVRTLDTVAFGDGEVHTLSGGWFDLVSLREDGVDAAFEVPWYGGEVSATWCGVWTVAGTTPTTTTTTGTSR